jgi:hypothetical protein
VDEPGGAVAVDPHPARTTPMAEIAAQIAKRREMSLITSSPGAVRRYRATSDMVQPGRAALRRH